MSAYEHKCQANYEIATDKLWEELNRECDREYMCAREGKAPDDCVIDCWIREDGDNGQ